MKNFKLLVICLIILFFTSISVISASDVNLINVDLDNVSQSSTSSNLNSAIGFNLVSSDSVELDSSINSYEFTLAGSNSNDLNSNSNSYCSYSVGENSILVDSTNVGNYSKSYLDSYNAVNSYFKSNVIYVGQNITIKGKGTIDDPFNNLKLALDNSIENTTINIASGSYYSSSNTDLTINIKGLTIKSYNGPVKLDGKYSTQIFSVQSDYVTIKGINFVNGYSSSGGAIGFYGSYGKIISCNFSSNKALGVGNAIYFDGYKGLVNNCIFKLNKGSDRAGAIGWAGNNGYLNNSSFVNNDACSYGGAIYWYADNGIINNSKFSKNTVINESGAIEWRGSNGLIINSLFEKNSATNAAGALGWYGVNGTILNSKFFNNSAINGSAIYIPYEELSFKINNSIFKDNHAKAYALIINSDNNTVSAFLSGGNNLLNAIYSGGSVYLDGKLASLSFFEPNQIIKVYAYNNQSKLIASSSNLTNNKGKVVFNLRTLKNPSSVRIVHFNDNYYDDIENSTNLSYIIQDIKYVSTKGSDFNSGDSLSKAYATLIKAVEDIGENGIIYVDDGVYQDLGLNISKSVSIKSIHRGKVYLDCSLYKSFINEIANNKTIVLDGLNVYNAFSNEYGAAISCGNIYHYSTLNISNSKFYNNKARNAGGVIYLGNASLNIVNSTFNNNLANKSGVIYISDGECNLKNSIFYNNRATVYAAAVVWASLNTFVNVDNCTFYNNSAKYNGAVFNTEVGLTLINNSYFYNNSVTKGGYGGIFCTRQGSLIIDSSVIINTTAPTGGIAYYYWHNSFKMTNSILLNNGYNPVDFESYLTSCVLENNWWGTNLTNNLNPNDYFSNGVVSNSYLVFSFDCVDNKTGLCKVYFKEVSINSNNISDENISSLRCNDLVFINSLAQSNDVLDVGNTDDKVNSVSKSSSLPKVPITFLSKGKKYATSILNDGEAYVYAYNTNELTAMIYGVANTVNTPFIYHNDSNSTNHTNHTNHTNRTNHTNHSNHTNQTNKNNGSNSSKIISNNEVSVNDSYHNVSNDVIGVSQRAGVELSLFFVLICLLGLALVKNDFN